MSFQREERYTVLKHSDITDALSANEKECLIDLEEKIAAYRENKGKHPLVCVVVEHDWPEYEPTWTAIQERMERFELPSPEQCQCLVDGKPLNKCDECPR